MLTHDSLLAWFRDLSKIIFDAKISIDNIKRIANPNDEIEKKVLRHGFFSYLYRLSRFSVVIQLCKIFNNNGNQKRNIHKLFNRLRIDEYDNTIKETLMENGRQNEMMNKIYSGESSSNLFGCKADIIYEIDSLNTEIEANNESIEKIKILRNQLYAHTDPDPSLPSVSNQELENLISLAIRIYNRLYGRLYDVTFLFEHNRDWKVDYHIKALSRLKLKDVEGRKGVH
jgi:hypothetical protein